MHVLQDFIATYNTSAKVAQRIHIVGGPGSGKTTLAKELGKWLGIPVYHLDVIAFEGRNFADRPLHERLVDVHSIAKQPKWIAEGIFLWWTDELLQSATLIVWLDHIEWHVAIWRIVRRFVRWGLKEVYRQEGIRKFTRFHDYARHLRQLADVFHSSRIYYSSTAIGSNARATGISRNATAVQLAPYMDKVVHCRNAHDIQMLVNSIVSQSAQTQAAANA